jgi:hypothetical protein
VHPTGAWVVGLVSGRFQVRDLGAALTEVETMPNETVVAYDDGQQYAATLGHFISLLVDSGPDPAVIFRVVKDGPYDEKGNFTRRIEVVLIPDGHVKEEIERRGVERIHKTLKALIEAGIVQ